VCQIPDFRKLMLDDHSDLLADIFLQLSGTLGRLDEDWISEHIRRIDDVEGDIDALLMRMAFVRTWTYIAHHTRFLKSARQWQEKTRDIEDRLSDALHERLIQRFVDRSRSIGKRRTPPRRGRHATPSTEEDAPRGGPFSQLARLRLPSAKTSGSALKDEGWVEDLIEASHERFAVDTAGRILDGDRIIARMTRGVDLLRPEVALTLREEIGSGPRMRILRRLVAFTRDFVGELLAPLRKKSDRELSPAARGLVYQLEQGLGTVSAEAARDQLSSLENDERRWLIELGVYLGERVIYVPSLLKPAAVHKRAALCAAHLPERGSLPSPRPGAVSILPKSGIEPTFYTAIGYPVFGPRAIRADVAERVHRHLSADEREASSPARLASWIGCPSSQLPRILAALDPYRQASGCY
jgi:ATP-dependent RNA helicase SUPV3L1/SUV3